MFEKIYGLPINLKGHWRVLNLLSIKHEQILPCAHYNVVYMLTYITCYSWNILQFSVKSEHDL